MGKGFFLIHRELIDDDLWLAEPFTRGQAWVDLIALANHKPGYIRKRGCKVEIKRGSVGYAQDALGDRWKWSRGKVKRFLNELEKVDQIIQQTDNRTTLIVIVNYDNYQGKNEEVVQQTDTKQNSKRYRNNNDNNDNNKKRGRFTPPSLDDVAQFCEQRCNTVNPETFIDFYESKGWLVGKAKMKDWKAAIRTWEKRGVSNETNKRPSKPSLAERATQHRKEFENSEQSGDGKLMGADDALVRS